MSLLPRRAGLSVLTGLWMVGLFAACQNGKTGSTAVPALSEAQDSGAKPFSGGFSVLGPVPDVRFLEKDSSFIVKGRVLEEHVVGTTEMRGRKTPKLAASVKVDDVLKGKPDASTITIQYAKDPLPVGLQLARGECALFFLRDGIGGSFEFVNLMTAKMRVTSRKIPLVESRKTPIEKLEAELYASLSDPDAEVRKTSLDQMDRLGKKASAAALETIATSSSLEDKGMAYAGLFYLRDYSRLRPAIQFVELPTSDPNTEYWQSRVAASIGVIGDNRWIQALEATKYNQVVKCSAKYLAKQPLDRSVLPLSNPLLSSSNVELRRGAAHALREICDPSTLPALAGSLSDSDRTVQYEAMMGLAALENFPPDLPAPTEDVFNQNPGQYVTKWKQWWESRGKARNFSGT